MGDGIVADAKTRAQDEARKITQAALAEVENQKRAALAELKNQVASLSIDIAEKVLKSELSNKESQAQLVEKMLGDAKLN